MSVPENPEGRCIGFNQAKKALAKNSAEKVFVAYDCDEQLKEEILLLCQKAKVTANMEYSMEELGNLCSIDVGASVVAKLK